MKCSFLMHIFSRQYLQFFGVHKPLGKHVLAAVNDECQEISNALTCYGTCWYQRYVTANVRVVIEESSI
jgi:hypothetical protein